MRLDQLQSFLVIAETASFRRAAEQLHTSQPTLSARIKTLETHLGVRLFERGAGGVRLTAAGHEFRPFATTAVGAMNRAETQLARPDGFVGSVSVGLHTCLVQSHGHAVVSGLRGEFPDRLVRIETGYSEDILALVANRLVDIGLVFVPRASAELSIAPLGDQQINLFTSHDLRLDDPSFPDRYVSVHWGDDFRSHELEALPNLGAPRTAVASPELAVQILLDTPAAAFLDSRHVDTTEAGRHLQRAPGAPTYARRVYSAHLTRSQSDVHTRLDDALTHLWPQS